MKINKFKMWLCKNNIHLIISAMFSPAIFLGLFRFLLDSNLRLNPFLIEIILLLGFLLIIVYFAGICVLVMEIIPKWAEYSIMEMEWFIRKNPDNQLFSKTAFDNAVKSKNNNLLIKMVGKWRKWQELQTAENNLKNSKDYLEKYISRIPVEEDNISELSEKIKLLKSELGLE